uniref:pyridoxamine 5'-phosphate oxidase family protein n=1 Tax=Parerythrobacter lutipelagi TaxID=1964208 RepID=UPI0010F81BE7|nr:pyridoxamine 5'-phosphate oxidase family protein [Parerythrobacter lutipelagi]
MLETFDDVRADIDRRLREAADNWRCAMHSAVIATADADARVMIVRGWDGGSRTLRFHTDARAPKAGLIGRGAPVGVLLYDKGEKVQIRCRGTGRIEREGPMVDAAWEESTNFARRCYLGEGPGAESQAPTSGLPPQFEGTEPDDAQLIPARDNFAILLVSVESFDWFQLAHTGHRRAILDAEGARWVSP